VSFARRAARESSGGSPLGRPRA